MVKEKIVDSNKALDQVRIWRRQDKKVVFTNGCFDLVHLGHIDYLEKAALLGNKMIVGLNSDKSVTRIKGQNRPIMDEQSRARLIASLGFVDLVVLFDDETPLKLITKLLPDVLVKGNDYLAENIIGSDVVIKNGGTIETVELIKGYSTSGIIEKIKSLEL